MPPSPTDIIQSFWLRFWRESTGDRSPIWRGMIWHDQQDSEDTAVAVPNPEAAFEFIRKRLEKSPLEENGLGKAPVSRRAPGQFHVPNWLYWPNLHFWRK
jgi:hypothetical protein